MRVEVTEFEQKYRTDNDPWDFATSPYEQRRYRMTMQSLARDRYQRCFEPGCSIGALTELLVECCDTVVACDASPTAIDGARQRLAATANVELYAATIPEWWPEGQFDLIVLSEFGYYWDAAELSTIVQRMTEAQVPSGELLAVHWLGSSVDHLLHGMEVHDVIARLLGPSDLRHEDSEGFLIERWTAPA